MHRDDDREADEKTQQRECAQEQGRLPLSFFGLRAEYCDALLQYAARIPQMLLHGALVSAHAVEDDLGALLVVGVEGSEESVVARVDLAIGGGDLFEG